MPSTTPKKPTTRKPAVRKTTAPRKTAAHPRAASAVPKTTPAPAADVNQPAETTVVKPMAKTGHGSSFYAVGKRKTSVAQIVLTEGTGHIALNKLDFEKYFQTPDLRNIVLQPLTSIGVDKVVNIKGKMHGGGIHSQAEALRHAISRALIQYNPESRRQLKKLGFLTRDPRVKERKKPGLKRARRAPQFSKR